jgi:hypothetical protein
MSAAHSRTVIAIGDRTMVAQRRAMEMAADHTVVTAVSRQRDKALLEAVPDKEKLCQSLAQKIQPAPAPRGRAQHPRQPALEVAQPGIKPAANPGHRMPAQDARIALVAVQHQIAPAVRGNMGQHVLHLEPATHRGAGPDADNVPHSRVVIAGQVDDPCSRGRPCVQFGDDRVMDRRPAQESPVPDVEDIADEVDRLAFGFAQEIEKGPRLRAERA